MPSTSESRAPDSTPGDFPARTIVHLMRHGEVHNPQGVLYGRLPGYVLSDLGHEMAQQVADFLAGDRNNPRADIAHVIASPLERAQQTAAPIAQAFDLKIQTDERIIEAGNHFEGLTFGVGDGSLKRPTHWRHLYNPFRPSWGEPYAQQVARMSAAIDDARIAATGREAILVSHQLPVWITRLALTGRRLWHDPRRRECSLASLTSFEYLGDELVNVRYCEPAADLLPGANKVAGA
ncbi:MAG TPA: histidine phosphatase family protein [Actinomycetales bacterium]|nr:histidine phosphatase family protein [Actinomycetales bacterium]